MDSESRERTLFVTNIHEDVTDSLLRELMVQAGPVYDVSLHKKGRIMAFVEFKHEESVPYAIALLNNVRMFGTALTLKPREGTKAAEKIYEAQRAERHEREKLEREKATAAAAAMQQQYTTSSHSYPQQHRQVNLATFAQLNAYTQQRHQQQPPHSFVVPPTQTPPPMLPPYNYQSPLPVQHFTPHQTNTATPPFPLTPYPHHTSPSQSPDHWSRNTPPSIVNQHPEQAAHLRRLQYESASQQRHGCSNQSGSFDHRDSSGRSSENSYDSSRHSYSDARAHPYSNRYDEGRGDGTRETPRSSSSQQRRNR